MKPGFHSLTGALAAAILCGFALSPLPAQITNALDDGFNPNVGDMTSDDPKSVLAMLVQTDGKIILGGTFSLVGGQPRVNIARVDKYGTPDPNFTSGAEGYCVSALALQADGKILVGGLFAFLGTYIRTNIGRLDRYGNVDTSFDPGADGGLGVRALAVQADGRILVGGEFTTLGGDTNCSYLGRLNTNGTLDATFLPAPDRYVYSLAVQPDGKILVGGWFDHIAGQPCDGLCRLNTNGSLDTNFLSEIQNGGPNALVLQPDGKILVGGQFIAATATNVARLNPDGSLDASFKSQVGYPAYSEVYSLALQDNGKIMVGGIFSTLDGGLRLRHRAGRLNADGTGDLTFNADNMSGVSGTAQPTCVWSLAVQPDGKILVGGAFTTLCGQTRNLLGRFWPDTLSTNAHLAGLTLSCGPFTPAFDPAVSSYSASVPNEVGNLTLTPLTANSATIQVRINGGAFTLVPSGTVSGPLMLAAGSNLIEVRVTAAEDGVAIKTYTLNINRALPIPGRIAGPVFPPPWGVNFGQSGSDDQTGRAAGKTWYFTNNPVPAAIIAYWGATNGGVKLSFDDSTYTGQEILTYRPDLSSLASGKVVWAGQTLTPVSGLQVYTRFVLAVTNQIDGTAIPLSDAAGVGLASNVGGVVRVTPGLSFKAVLLFEASYNVNGPFDPAIEFFDTQVVRNPPYTSAYSSFGAGFYYLPTLNRITSILRAGGQVGLQYENLPSQSYTLWCSTNMTAWRQVTVAVSDTNGVVPFVDPAPPTGRAFYRVRCP